MRGLRRKLGTLDYSADPGLFRRRMDSLAGPVESGKNDTDFLPVRRLGQAGWVARDNDQLASSSEAPVPAPWPGERSSHGGVDEIALPRGPGRLWLCGKHFVGADPE